MLLKTWRKKALKNPGRALENELNVGSACAFASRTPKAALTASPDVINVYHAEKKYIPRKLCLRCCLVKWLHLF